MEVAKNLEGKHSEDFQFLASRVDKTLPGLVQTLSKEENYCYLSYTEAIEILTRKGLKFEVPVKWGIDLQSEHERYLCEKYCDNKPLFLTHYPMEIKPFYMKESGDGKTVEAMDLLVPRVVGLRIHV